MIIGVGCCFSATVAMVICCPSYCILLTEVGLVNAELLEAATEVPDCTGLIIVMLLDARGASWVTWDRNGPVAT